MKLYVIYQLDADEKIKFIYSKAYKTWALAMEVKNKLNFTLRPHKFSCIAINSDLIQNHQEGRYLKALIGKSIDEIHFTES